MRVRPQRLRLAALLLAMAVMSIACVASTSGGPSSPVVVGETLAGATPVEVTSAAAATPVTQVPTSTPRRSQAAASPTTPSPQVDPVERPGAVTPTPVATPPSGELPAPTDEPVPADVPATPPATATPDANNAAPTATAIVVPATPTPLPPGAFETPEEAMARAAEVGCSGFRGERVDGSFGYFPCGSTHEYQTLVSGGPFNLSGEACTLDSNPDVRFTAPITEIDMISLIIPSGSPNGAVIKPHSYIHPATIGGARVNSFIYAPADSWLQSIAYYNTSLGTSEYLLTFYASCEVAWRIDHILTPVDSILAVAPTTPANSSATTKLEQPIFFKAGDLVARSRGAGDGFGPWDFGAYNTTVVNTFANQDRYGSATNTGQSINSVCPYDLYDEPLRSQFHAFFGGNSGSGYPDAPCPGGRDVPGALAGAWFAPDGASDGGGFAIALLGDNEVMMTGAGLDVRVAPGAPTWADPGLVTTSHCYDGGQWGKAYLELLAPDRLAVADGGAVCPTSLPVNHTVFVR